VIHGACIPRVLQQLDQWVCWRAVSRDGKLTKVPYQPNGIEARTNAPSTWSRFEDTRQAQAAGGFTGIGFVFSEYDPYCGLDLDHCRHAETREVAPWARELVQRFASYTEVTPSGTGFHILIEGRLPAGGRRHGGVEVYDRARFFTMTGNHLSGAPGTIAARQDVLDTLLAEWPTRPATAPAPAWTPCLADDLLLARAFRARNGVKARLLWEGHAAGYGSPSEADLALCCQLAFWTRDRTQLDWLFRRSARVRVKWYEPHRGDGATYGEITLERALALTTVAFGGREIPPPALQGVEVPRLAG
jgi:primase-polymerase (primpol)-like protein